MKSMKKKTIIKIIIIMKMMKNMRKIKNFMKITKNMKKIITPTNNNDHTMIITKIIMKMIIL